MGKSPFEIKLTDAEREELTKRSREQKTEYRRVVRARMILYAADGLTNVEIATRLDTPERIVSKWRCRFFKDRLAGLEDAARSGRPACFSPHTGHLHQSARM